MTRKHVVIITILLLLALSLACGPIGLVLPGSEPTLSPTVPPTEAPTATKIILPTATLVPATQAAPSATPLAGWKRFSAGGMEIWLPESFQGGTAEDIKLIMEQVKALGPEFQQAMDMMSKNPDAMVLFAMALSSDNTSNSASVNVIKQKTLSFVTIDKYLEMIKQQLPQSFKVTETTKVNTGAYEAGRLLIEATVQGITVEEVMYVIKDLNLMWAVTYSSQKSKFEANFPDFEHSISTFKVLPPE